MISDDKDFDRRSSLHSKIFLFACATQIYENLVGILKASVILDDFSWSEAYPCKHIFISLHIPYIFLLSNSIFYRYQICSRLQSHLKVYLLGDSEI